MENPGGGRRGLWEGRRHRPAPCYPGRPRKRAGLAPRLRKRPPPIPERPGPVRGARLGAGRPASSRGAMGSVDHTHASPARTADPRVSTRLLRDPGEGFAPPSRPTRRNFPGCVLKTLAECGAKDPRNRGGPAALMPTRAVSKSSTLSGFLRLRAELRAPAFPAAGRAHRVPCVALHADHLVQPAVFGLGGTGHRGGEVRAVYNGFGRRERCFTETDLITIRFGRLGSKGGLARFNAWTIRAWTAGMSSVSGPYRTMCRADFPFPFKRWFGSARFVPWRKNKLIHLGNTAIENTASEVRSVVSNPTARAM